MFDEPTRKLAKVPHRLRWRSRENAFAAITRYAESGINFATKRYNCPLCGSLDIERLQGEYYCHSCKTTINPLMAGDL